MYFKVQCPKCGKNLKVAEEHFGKKAQCPYCGKVLQLERLPAPEAPPPVPELPPAGGGADATAPAPPPHTEAPSPPQPPPWESPPPPQPPPSPAVQPPPLMASPVAPPPPPIPAPPPTRARRSSMDMWITLGVGVGITLVFYVAIVLPLHTTYFGSLFAHRTWVPYVIVLLSAWSVSMLYRRFRGLRKQKRSLLFDVLPTEISPQISPDNVDAFVGHIYQLPSNPGDSFMIARVSQALAHFRARGSAQEVSSVLASQAEIDATAVASSYTIIKLFVWAIPILGFIGTVIGIGSAVGGFSQSIQGAQELDLIKDSLNSVTTGLAVAFDTTLLALIVSILLMFPTRSMQKAEEDLLNSVDKYVNENLLPRLAEKKEDQGNVVEQVSQAVRAALAEHESDSRQWADRLDAVGETLARHVTAGWDNIHEQMSEDRARQQSAVTEIIESASRGESQLLARAEEIQDRQVEKLTEVVSAMGTTADRIQQQVATLQETQMTTFQDVVAALSGDLETLRDASRTSREESAAAQDRRAAELSQTLEQLRSDAETTREALAESLRTTGQTFQRELQDITSKADEALQGQMTTLSAVGESLDSAAQTLSAVLEKAASLHERNVSEVDSALADQADQILTRMAESQDQALGRLGEVSAGFVEQVRGAGEGMASAHSLQVRAWDRIHEQYQTDQDRAAQRHAEQTEQFATAVGEMVASIGKNLQAGFEQQREAADRAAAGQLSKFSSAGGVMVASLVQSQQKFGEHVASFVRMLDGQERLVEVQKTLAANMEMVAKSGSLSETLAGVERAVDRLTPILARLDRGS